MSQANVEIVVGTFQAVNARDFQAAMKAYAQEVTLTIHSESIATAMTISGIRDVGSWFGDWFSQFADDYRFEINETHDCDDRVFLVATHHGRGRASGVPTTQRPAYVYTLCEGKISRIEVWEDRETALADSGLELT